MSISSEIRGYADTAIEQGRHALAQAQGQLNGVTGAVLTPANKYVGQLRAQADKAVNLDAIKSAVQPYLAQADGYRHSVADRAETLLNTAKKDPRVAKALGAAESVTGAVVTTVQQRVVAPARALTRREPSSADAPAKPAAATPAKSTAKPGSSASKPATKPASTRAADSKAPGRKVAARKSPASESADNA